MKLIGILKTLSFLLLLLCSTTTLFASPTDSKTLPLTAQFSLETPKTIVLGEPIILYYTLANPSSQKVAAKTGSDNMAWLTLTMTDTKEDAAKTIPQIPPAQQSPFGLTDSGIFDPGYHMDHEIVVTRYLALSKPGDYTLTIHVHLPYAVETNPSEDSADPLLASSSTVFVQDINIPITVKPTDPKELQATAEALIQRILDMKSRPKTLGLEVLVDALCTMPEAEAGPSWQTLASVTDHYGLPAVVATALARMPSNKSADILAEVAWEQPAVPADLAQGISYKLAAMYNVGTPPLRAHIKTLYWEHGVKIGSTIPIPAVQN